MMAAITHVFTLSRVAQMLGEDEDWLSDISIEMEPEDGIISVYGLGEDCTPAFTHLGIENLRQIIEIHRENSNRPTATNARQGNERPVTYDSLKVMRKGGRRDALAINPQTAARLRAYLELAGHGSDSDGAMFRPRRHNGKQDAERRHMDPDAIDRVVRKYAVALGLARGYSAHSMRATFITTALENGAQLEDVQKAAGHRDPSTTKLYDLRGYNPEKAASFFATY
jgi:integrase